MANELDFSSQQVLVVTDTALINAVLRDRPDGFRRPSVTAEVSDELGGERGVFLAEGAAWRNQRKMVMQAFAPHAIKAYFPLLARVGARLHARWAQATQEGRTMSAAEASAAKLYCARAATEVAMDAVQLLGGNGYMQEYRVEMLARDAKLLQIGGGTDEIQIINIARNLLGHS